MKTGTQMALFDTPAQEAEPPVRVLEERLAQWEVDGLVVKDPGPVACVSVRCKKRSEYLKGGYVLCPACSAAAFREVYPNGWKQSNPEALPSSAPLAQ